MMFEAGGEMGRQIWMRCSGWWLIGLIILLSIAGVTAAEDLSGLSFYDLSQNGDTIYKPDELIVRFADVQPGAQLPDGTMIIGPLSRIAIRDAISDFAVAGAFVHKEYDRIVPGLTVIKLPEGVSVLNALVSLNQTANVLYAEPNYKLKLTVIPNDTRFSQLWGMNNTGQTGGTIDADIDAPEAWDMHKGSSSVIVAVTDTGVDYTHPDLAANMWVNPGEVSGNGIDDDGDGYIDDVYGCDTGDNDGDPMDDCNDPTVVGHGTHVSGTIGAVGNNARGVAGVCWDVSIMAVKSADANGILWLDAAIQGIQYATSKHVDVINASWGSYSYSQPLYDAIKAAGDAGILFVAAAANDNLNNDAVPFYPSSYNLDNIIAVMATTDTDQKAGFSNYGLISVDLGAPGSSILSTIPGGNYGYKSGTSMATPHVVGACALLWAADPSLTYSQLKSILLDTVDPTLPGRCVSGGRLDVFNAIYDGVAPLPDPAEWEMKPQATGLDTIAMKAKVATDRSGVEYFFDCVTDANFTSDWQSGRLYERGDFEENTTYTFRVKYRDKSENLNETDWSSEESATTASGSDTIPPFPSPSQWKIKPKLIRLQPTPVVRMSAETSTDENGPVEYFFTCTYIDPPGPPPSNFNSGWISSNTYTISSGLTQYSTYTFTVIARDALLTETVVSAQASVTVSGQGKNVLTVPVPYATIQAAIDAASDGDTVEVRRGTYRGYGNHDISFKGKAITVRSVDPNDPSVVASTIIDVEQVTRLLQDLSVSSLRAFDFCSAEGPNSILAGFTIKNGLIFSKARNGSVPDGNGVDGEDDGGGAIRCWRGSSPTIRNCVITDCWVFGEDGGDGAPGDPDAGTSGSKGGHGGRGMGGAIYCDLISVPTISNCTISSCLVVGGYGGNGGHGDAVQDPTTAGGVGGNAGDANDGVGGGICDAGSNAIISNCTIGDCFASLGIGGVGGMGAVSNGLDGTDANGFGGGVFYGYGYMSSTIDTKVIGNGAYDEGGGIYFGYTNSYTQYKLINCEISDNLCISGNGGGIWYDVNGTLDLNNCDVIGNTAPAGYSGGGIYAGGLASPFGVTVIIDINSTISGNTAGYSGGGLCLIKTNLTVEDSTISDNSAFEGAGVWAYNCTADINNCTVRGNSATELGGGFSFVNSVATSRATINNSIMTGNSASGSADGTGGALFFEGFSYSPHRVTNCLITDNIAYSNGGGLSNNSGAWVQITNCTFAGNEVNRDNGVGGGISCAEYWAYVEIFSSILWGNEAVGGGSQIAVGDPDGSMQLGDGPYADVDVSYSDVQGGEEGIWLEDETQEFTALWWLGGSINEDPLFTAISATEQTYFLSQVAAEQLQDSPCVDAGYGSASGLESIIGMPLTTRTDYVADSGTVDMGYHYKVDLAVRQYQLTIEVIDQGYGPFGTVLPPWEPGTYVVNQGRVIGLHAEPNDGWEVYEWTGTDYVPVYPADPNYNTVTMDSDKTVTVEFGPSGTYKLVTHVIGNGTIEPSGLTIWPPGTVVPLTATPNNPSETIRWTGTDDDLSISRYNTVTMNAHKEVFVKFYEPRMLDVPGDYTNIQLAINDANDGDFVVIAPGVYDITDSSPPLETEYLFISGKSFTITSVNPDDPCVVAATIIQDGGFVIENVNRGMIIDGITVRGAHYSGNDNWHLTNMGYIRGGKGFGWGSKWAPPLNAGVDGTGGHVGDAYGGGIELRDILLGTLPPGTPCVTSPDIRNCIFINCSANGIHGGDGASSTGEYDRNGLGGWGGWGGAGCGGGAYCGSNSNAIFTNCTFIDCWARGGDGGDGGDDPHGHGGSWGDPLGPWEYGPFEDEWKYSGYGGAVYCAADSFPEFVDCNFINNNSYGGSCGVSGTDGGYQVIGWPYEHYRIDRFGGAVYAAESSSPVFNRCAFIDNEADVNGPELWVGREDVNTYDPYISYGGAVAFEYSALITFDKCTFNDNLATVGGGIWGTWSDSDINDCNFVQNTAYHGGGVYFVGGMPEIVRSDFSENEALYDAITIEPDDQNEILIFGEGGGIHIFDADATVVDCNVSNNNAGGSGGGIYVSGSSKPLVKNCLITGNFAVRDGGGISANWHSDVNIANCTIADNAVTVRGTNTGFGGGLYCSYNSYVDIINSIIWGNFGTEGAQLALFTGFKSDPRPSTVDVKYSAIGPSGDVDVIMVPAEALVINVTNDADVLVDSILGPGIELIGEPQYTGAGIAAGTFVGGLAAGIGIESGVILTSGDVNLALPPNTNDSITADNNLPGDPDLDSLLQEVTDVNTFDAAILEFTFRTRGGNLFFNFVFASEEYNEFTNSPYNDVFGFFLDGENIALIPGTTTPVAINNVNGGNPLGTSATNSYLFNNNDPSDGGPFFDIQYDGFTDVFTAQAFSVGRGTHTIKLAIADKSDYVLDSAVFIEGGSFSDKPLYPPPVYVDTGCVLNGWDANAPDPNDPWNPNTYNLKIDDDPLLVNGYYLSQIAAGQLFDSPCVDDGSGLSSNLGLDTYTTRTDSFPDTYDPNNPDPNSVIVDMGYHYPLFTAPQYQLTFEVNDVNVIEPNIYDPNYDGLYNWYTTVSLRIDSNSYNKDDSQIWWTGTDDDSLSGPNNTVTMDSDKLVTARPVKAKYYLTIGVDGGNGRLFAEWLNEYGDPCDIEDPRTCLVKFGTVVQLRTEADEGFRVKRWSGTDNDASRDPNNTVTINFNRTVRVEFGPPVTVAVPGDYSSIQQALDAAEDGDTVLIAPGTYTTSTGYRIWNKSVTMSGIAPDDPCVVAATVINLEIGEEGYINTSAFDVCDVGPETVLNGITIRGFSHRAYSGLDADELGEDGYNGGHAFGGGILCRYMASPTIKNCIIADCDVIGGTGGDGYDGSGSEPTDPNIRGTDGGWPGRAYGGGLACRYGSSPIVINCTFDNCVAIGGNGGDGGSGNTAEDAYARGGRGGGWYYGEDSYWYNKPWAWSSQGYARYGPVFDSFYDFYTEYTARGGAVFVGEQCSPVFTHCTFTNNRTEGGTCGICGLDGWPPNHRSEPSLRWEIENFGGAVYCETNSFPTFIDCTFAGNTADVNYPSYNDDPYVSYGGAVAWETDANVVFENCTFNDNLAGIGGAMYGEWANPSIVDCNLTANTAYHGGGLYFVGGIPEIVRSDFSENEALYDTSITDSNNPVEVLGEGGAIHCLGGNVTIVDCNIFNNDAAISGGGIYITGSSESLVKNCLITDNFASRDGGGASVNWYSDCNIVNCTISGNMGLGYGGGLYCSYDSYTNIINSIIWDNVGINGSQLAIATGYVYDPRPSVANISYSDVGFQVVEYEPVDANGLPTIRAGFDTNELAANDDESTSLVDIGFEIDFFGEAYSQLYVNNNGNVTFDANMAIYTPFGLTGDIGTHIIAPFFADVDTRPGVGSTGALTLYGTGTVDGHAAFGATWIDVGYFSIHWDKLNSFQLVLIDRSDRAPGDFDVEFNYEKIQWETGDASGGSNGFGGYSARAGFSSGTGNPGTFYEFEGSGVPGAFLDSSPTGLIYGSRKSAVNGRYIFAVQSGLPELLAIVPIYVDVNCTLDGLDWIDANDWEPNFTDYHNINEDPCFVAGYFLSQVAAGQLVESNCVDGGSTDANDPNIGLHTYTTRTDSVSDGGIVDMGYHCRPFTVPQYRLTFEAIDVGEPGWPVPEIIEPVGAEPNFYESLCNWYTTVQLRIDSNNYDPNIYQVLWTGTDDDDISGPDNTVTVNGDRVVTVQLVKTKYNLTIEVYGENGRLFAEWSENDIFYNIEDPDTSPVKFGTVVQLTAEPDEGFRVKKWIGTDDDSSRNPNNTVTMNSDRTVRVEFGLPVVVSVPQDYATIQDAVSAAEDGDTVVVYPGAYYGGYQTWMLVVDKSVTIRSEHPDDPCCVAETIIDGYRGLNEFTNRGIVFTANAILNGLTIQNCGGYIGDSEDGSRTDPCHPDGWDGGCAEGHAVYIYEGTSPVIKNCIIRDNVTIGGDAGSGVDADDEYNAGRGGWAGWAHGGAVYCGVNSSPQFINCKILNNEARGGNGGNGGSYTEDGGRANYGGNWSRIGSETWPVIYFDSDSLGTTSITDRNLWEVLEWDLARSYWPMYGQPTRTSYFGDYRWYSGYGGGVYCDENSTVDFNNCTISGNIALGGMSGQGGERSEAGRQQEPMVPYEIPSYGGGVYCAADAFVTFSGCTITDNISSPLAYVDPNNPDSGLRHSIDPYLGHGGGVCAEKTASVAFIDCAFSENEASLGGGMFWDDANAKLIDSDVVDNMAYKGGGVYFNSGLAEIVQSDFGRNDANGPAGEGGGIYCSDANITIIDCNLIYNDANSSGGGAYVSNSVVWFKNCLITSNLAGRDGGGVSVNLYAESLITNCTFVSNAAPGTFGELDNTGFGGGLYCGYETNCEVSDSIFWGNLAIRGVEIAVHTGFEHDPSPSTLTISYSDVKGEQAGVGVDTGCTLNWLAGNIATDPLFVTGLRGEYYLSQTDSGQSQNSPCVDVGSDLASNLDMVVNLIDMTGYTTRTDEELDRGIVDMGYHYPSVYEICGFCNLFDKDLNGDPEGFIDFRDFAMFALHWLDVGCSGANGWCAGTDFTIDTVVNNNDLAAFVNCWLTEDASAPIPNPSEWEDPPHIASPTSISMEAKEAVDGWGWNVKYYFERLPLGDPCSGWRSSPTWTDTSIILGTQYGYRVKTKDELGNESEWSEIGYAGINDNTAPDPAPYIDTNEPNSTTITMTSRVSYDDSGDEYVEYYFEADTNVAGADDSGWLSFALGETPTYTDFNLVPETQYAYRVRAKDGYNNETSRSDWVYITTLSPPDQDKPLPNPAQWDPEGEPNGSPRMEYHWSGPTDYWAEMRAQEATDASIVYYKFVCDNYGGLSSDWQTDRRYAVNIGYKTVYTLWYVIVRDEYWNITDPSPIEAAWPAPPYGD